MADEPGPALDFMNEVMQPAADVIWGAAGYVIDAEGEHDLSPTTDEGWAEVRAGALDVIAAGEALKTADFARDHENWDAFAEGIVGAGGLARDAVDAQDGDAVFDAGEQLYRVCLACHQFYRVGEFAEPE
jgi:mono/diheme cytochrome c family protein